MTKQTPIRFCEAGKPVLVPQHAIFPSAARNDSAVRAEHFYREHPLLVDLRIDARFGLAVIDPVLSKPLARTAACAKASTPRIFFHAEPARWIA